MAAPKSESTVLLSHPTLTDREGKHHQMLDQVGIHAEAPGLVEGPADDFLFLAIVTRRHAGADLRASDLGGDLEALGDEADQLLVDLGEGGAQCVQVGFLRHIWSPNC